MERIVPANLDGDDLWRRNGEYVDAESYDALVARVAELEAAIEFAATVLEDGADPMTVARGLRLMAANKPEV